MPLSFLFPTVIQLDREWNLMTVRSNNAVRNITNTILFTNTRYRVVDPNPMVHNGVCASVSTYTRHPS